jgi:hypothetical protein
MYIAESNYSLDIIFSQQLLPYFLDLILSPVELGRYLTIR